MFFPILIGSVVNTLLALPAPALLSIACPATNSFAVMSSFGAIKKASSEKAGRAGLEKSSTWDWFHCSSRGSWRTGF